jgi:hypothetical protein
MEHQELSRPVLPAAALTLAGRLAAAVTAMLTKQAVKNVKLTRIALTLQAEF